MEFAIAGLSPNVLSPGDVVDLRVYTTFFGDAYWGGYLVVERDSKPAIFTAAHMLPEFTGVPDLAVAGADAACPPTDPDNCRRLYDFTVTANSASATVAAGESASVGGFIVHNDGYFDNTGCDPNLGFPAAAFSIAMYEPRDE